MKKLILIGLMGVLLGGCGGAKGDTGPAGAAGLTIKSGVTCSKISSGLLFKYESVFYSTGDRFVTCDIGDNYYSVSSTKLYTSTQVGAATGVCIITDDIDSPFTGGFWTFSSQNGVNKTVYSDSGSANNGATVTLASSDCTAF